MSASLGHIWDAVRGTVRVAIPVCGAFARPRHWVIPSNRRMGLVAFVLLMVLQIFGAWLGTSRGGSALLPSGFSRVTVTNNFRATSLTFAPDGRLFLTRARGVIRIYKNGTLLATPYDSLSTSTEEERGLVGLTFDPQFTTNCFVYVYYTTGPGAPGFSGTPTPRVSRLHGCGDVADPGETIIRDFPSSSLSFHHNGGDIHFGPDGKLYVGIGDGENSALAQKLGSFRGKILRLNKDGSVPSDNPFVGVPGARPEIWARGLRQPWRHTFRPANGALLVADVGATHWEELNVIVKGANYGWNKYEGPCPRDPVTGEADCVPDPTIYPARFEFPIFFYFHDPLTHPGEGTRALIGGVFVEGGNYPAKYQGRYFYGDLVAHFVRTIRLNDVNQIVKDEAFDVLPRGPSCFALGPDGNVYVADYFDATVYKYVYTP